MDTEVTVVEKDRNVVGESKGEAVTNPGDPVPTRVKMGDTVNVTGAEYVNVAAADALADPLPLLVPPG